MRLQHVTTITSSFQSLISFPLPPPYPSHQRHPPSMPPSLPPLASAGSTITTESVFYFTYFFVINIHKGWVTRDCNPLFYFLKIFMLHMQSVYESQRMCSQVLSFLFDEIDASTFSKLVCCSILWPCLRLNFLATNRSCSHKSYF